MARPMPDEPPVQGLELEFTLFPLLVFTSHNRDLALQRGEVLVRDGELGHGRFLSSFDLEGTDDGKQGQVEQHLLPTARPASECFFLLPWS